MNTCCVNTENMFFNCFRCGSKGHVIRIIKFLRKKFNLDIINEILDTGSFSSTEGEDSGKRMKTDNYASSRNVNNSNVSQNHQANGYSDFSDLEFYKVSKSKRSVPSGVESSSAISESEFLSDSYAEADGNSIATAPAFSPLLKKNENSSFIKKNVNNTKNPFSVSNSINNSKTSNINNNNNLNNENDKDIDNTNNVHISNNNTNNNNDNENFKTNKDKKTFKFISSNPNYTNNNDNNFKTNNYNNNYQSSFTTADNKAKFSISSPISSISGANLNLSLAKNSSFKISISNINLINEMYKRINMLQEEKHLIVKDYLINERKISEKVLKFYKIGASFEKFKNTDFDYITLPTVTFPMFYPTDNASERLFGKSFSKTIFTLRTSFSFLF